MKQEDHGTWTDTTEGLWLALEVKGEECSY